MKSLNFFTRMVLLVLATSFGAAYATPSIDSINVQGYLKKADNTAVTNGTYNIVFGVVQNGTVLWAKEYSTVISNGLFSKTLSGAGQDLSAGTWSHCTGGVNADFSAATLNPAALVAGATGALVVKVCSRSTIDASQPQFDLTLSAVPTAFIADTAAGVTAGAVTVAGVASASKANASAGAGDAGKIVLLDAGGLLDTTLLPTIPVANGGTGGTTAAAARTGLGAAESGSNSSITEITGLTTDLTLAQGGTGASTASGARTNLGAAASGANADITELTGLTTMLALNQGGTGANLTAANGGAVYSGAAGLGITAAGTAGQVLTSAGAAAPVWSTPTATSSRSNIYRFEDFNQALTGAAASTGTVIGNAIWTATATAPTAASTTSTTESGLYRISTGTGANQTAALSFCGQGAAGTPAFNHSFNAANPWTMEARFSVSASATTNQYLRFGMIQAMTNTTTGAQGAYIEIQPASTTVTAVSRNAGGVSAGVTGTFTAGTMHRWTIVFDGTTITYSKDGVAMGAAYNSNLATGIAVCPGFFVQGTAAAPTARTIDIDYMTISQTSTR